MDGWEEVEVLGDCEVEEIEAEIHEGLEARVGKDAFVGIESTLTFTEVYIGDAPFQSVYSHV